MSIFHKNSGKGYNICKKFQIGSVILMAQITYQKKTELIDYFDLVWTKTPRFEENFLKMEAISFQNSPQNRILETSIRHKNCEKGPTFSSKIPERVDIGTIKWHTPVRKYNESPGRAVSITSVWPTGIFLRFYAIGNLMFALSTPVSNFLIHPLCWLATNL